MREVKEITFTCSKQVSSLNTPTPKTFVLHIVSCIIGEEALDRPWCFQYKVLKVGRRNSLSYAVAIPIVEE
jgi:hypothetical protein